MNLKSKLWTSLWFPLSSRSFKVLNLILRVGYCVLGLFHVLVMFMEASSRPGYASLPRV